uniref:Uncharacterized protein n=1 Tax=Anguilla anguilla TaxID=7936 RepID=A0A0E9R571_ANGAN
MKPFLVKTLFTPSAYNIQLHLFSSFLFNIPAAVRRLWSKLTGYFVGSGKTSLES